MFYERTKELFSRKKRVASIITKSSDVFFEKSISRCTSAFEKLQIVKQKQ